MNQADSILNSLLQRTVEHVGSGKNVWLKTKIIKNGEWFYSNLVESYLTTIRDAPAVFTPPQLQQLRVDNKRKSHKLPSAATQETPKIQILLNETVLISFDYFQRILALQGDQYLFSSYKEPQKLLAFFDRLLSTINDENYSTRYVQIQLAFQQVDWIFVKDSALKSSPNSGKTTENKLCGIASALLESAQKYPKVFDVLMGLLASIPSDLLVQLIQQTKSELGEFFRASLNVPMQSGRQDKGPQAVTSRNWVVIVKLLSAFIADGLSRRQSELCANKESLDAVFFELTGMIYTQLKWFEERANVSQKLGYTLRFD
jgi:hypothetical protein